MTIDEIRKSLGDESDALDAIDTNTPEGQKAFWAQYYKVRVGISNIMPYLRVDLNLAALQEALRNIESQMEPEAKRGDVQQFDFIKDALRYYTDRFRL